MDFFVMVIVALITAIIASLAAVFNKKRIGTILIWAASALIAGLLIGYLLSPYIIAFL